jgi:hypothetical protein
MDAEAEAVEFVPLRRLGNPNQLSPLGAEHGHRRGTRQSSHEPTEVTYGRVHSTVRDLVTTAHVFEIREFSVNGAITATFIARGQLFGEGGG